MIDTVLVDDHRLVRQGVRSILMDEPNIRVIAEASSGEEALSLLRKQRADVVMMDLEMPGMGGVEAIRRLQRLDPKIRIIAITGHNAWVYPRHALRAGAMAFLHKSCCQEEVVEAIRTAYCGRRYISSEIARRLALNGIEGSEENPFDALTRREFDVLIRILNGQKGRIIADELCLSPKTISTYRARLFERLGVQSDAELARLAIDFDLIGDGVVEA